MEYLGSLTEQNSSRSRLVRKHRDGDEMAPVAVVGQAMKSRVGGGAVKLHKMKDVDWLSEAAGNMVACMLSGGCAVYAVHQNCCL